MGDKTMKIIKSPKRAEGEEKVMQINSQEFKICICLIHALCLAHCHKYM